MAVSSSSFYNSLGIKNTGIGGLVSGLNTEEIVEALTAGTRGKIATQNQQLQTLKWQQTAYRSVRNALDNFNSVHFTQAGSSNGVSNIANPNFFNTYKGVVTATTGVTNAADKISLVSSLTNKVGSLDITDMKLATQEKIVVNNNGGKFSSNLESEKPINYPFTDSFYGKTLEFELDRSSVTIRLDALDDVATKHAAGDYVLSNDKYERILKEKQITTFPVTLEQAYEIELQYQIDRHCGTKTNALHDPLIPTTGPETISVVTAEINAITAGSEYSVTLDSATSRITLSEDCKVLGLSATQTNKLDLKKSINDVFGVSGDTFTFKINNASITVSGTDTVQTLMNRINNSSAGVTLEYSILEQQFVFTATKTGAGNNIQIEDTVGDLMRTFVGAKGSTTLTSNVMNNYSLGYDVDIEVDGIDLTDIDNLLDSMYASGDSAFLTINVGGKSYELEIKDVPEGVTKDGKRTYGGRTSASWLQMNLRSAYAAAIKEDEDATDPGIQFYIAEDKDAADGSYKFYITTPSDEPVSISATAGSTYDLVSALGTFPSLTNDDLSTSTQLKDLFDPAGTVSSGGTFTMLKKDGTMVQVSWSPTDYLRDFLDTLNSTFGAGDDSFATLNPTTGRITLNGGDGEYSLFFDETTTSDPTNGGNLLDCLFGFSQYDGRAVEKDPNYPTMDLITHKQGSNAEVTIKGTHPVTGLPVYHTVSSQSNTFLIDGIGFEIHEAWESSDPSKEYITIGSKSDPEDLMDKIAEFIDQYNALVQSLNTLIYEDKNSDYPPLTDEQKAEMTDEQIRNWENEAKKGLLRNDAIIRGILDDFRLIISTKVEAAGLSLYDIGIEVESYTSRSTGTGYNLEKAGLLKIDETKLRSAIEMHPDAVKVLFTNNDPPIWETRPDGQKIKTYDGDMGLSHRLSEVINNATYISSGDDRGSLVRVAGLDVLTADNTSEIGRKIERIDAQIATLKSRLEAEYKRHWSKFTALETAIQKMNAQSSWLADFGA